MLDLRRLRVLHAVSQQGSVTAAAAALGYSGSAVSQQLAALEREVGMPLTERAGRRIALTPAADILVAHTDVLLARLEAAEAEISGLRDQVSGDVGLAAFPSAAATILPLAWARLRDTAPHVQLSARELEPDDSLPALLRGDIDVAVAHEYDVVPRPLGPGFDRRELLSDPVLLAVSAGSPLGREGPVPLGSLASHPFLAPHPRTSCAEMTQRVCAAAGFVPRVVARAADFSVLLNLAAVGAGVALVPRLAAQHIPAGARLVELADPATRQVFTASRRGGHHKPAIRVVLEALAEAAAELDPGA